MKSPLFRRIAVLSLFGVCLIATTIGAQQFTTSASTDGDTARLVCKMIERSHINQEKIDDRISQSLFTRYLEDLDPNKLYFLKTDVDSWKGRQNELDDKLKNGDISFAKEVFTRYLELVEQQTDHAQELIDQEFDFTVDEEITVDPDVVDWGTAEERAERWRKRIKYELLDLKLEDNTLEEAREQLHRRYRTIAKNLKLTDEHEITEMYLSALTRSFDPHSSYMSPQTLEDFQINMRLSLEGIGAQLRYDDGFTVVAEVVKGGAADKDKRLKAGDKIVAVGQEEGDMVDIVEMKLKDVVRLIRGPSGTKVRLKVKKAEGGEPAVYEMVRQKIELNEQEVKGEILDLEDRIGRPTKVGLINIPSFYRDFAGAQNGDRDFKSTEKDVRKVLADFEKQGGVDAVVIDLRNNGGGALSEAIGVSGLFIKQGPVVQVKEIDGTVRSHDDENSDVAYDGPLVVICNRLSASASEIFAGVIVDYNRGIVVGDYTTHGKGTVQNVMPVADPLFRFRLFQAEDRGALKLTIQQFYRVNGDSTQNRGVRSDIVLPSRIDHMDLGESFLDNALEFDRIERAKGVYNAGLTSGPIVDELQKSSKERIAGSDEFAKLKAQIDRLVERKNRKSVSLNEEVLGAERELEEETDEIFPTIEGDSTSGGDDENEEEKSVFPDTFYNDEVLEITSDYVSLLRQMKIVQGR
ncbi:carboxy terminal-processing peptidase [Rubinisphaera margarita]|uniref:carboxy terminal-processing peptidase n=1 Tax=Rubinisphaera margarita TaxID=2909586 RepID=UPI001EE7C92A|nr:carboxy terminal-processing peptidase [Rubinisphaera margarita]MCG6155714.1 carboxy terminal-processing peptidase [Rubinisphaera margarita]